MPKMTYQIKTSEGWKKFEGAAYIHYPFIIHRPLYRSPTYWCITHMASGLRLCDRRLLKDAKKAVKSLSQHPQFLLPTQKDLMKAFEKNKIAMLHVKQIMKG